MLYMMPKRRCKRTEAHFLHINKLTISVVSQSHITLPALWNLRNVTQDVYLRTRCSAMFSVSDWRRGQEVKVERFSQKLSTGRESGNEAMS